MRRQPFSSGAVILARLDSTRNPGKALRGIGGMPMVELVARRLLHGGFGLPEIALATTDRAIDQGLVDWADSFGIGCYRGSAEDVAQRFIECAERFGYRFTARVNGDSPFIEGTLIREGLRVLERGEAVFVSNVIQRTYPYGVAVEAVEVDFYRASLASATAAQREHVTAHLYADLPANTHSVVRSGIDLSKVRLCVDTLEDEQRISAYLKTVGCDPVTVNAVDLATAILHNERTA